MDISTDRVKELRDKTGISIMQCRKALEEAGGDMEKAVILLQKSSKTIASKKLDRNLGSGTVAAYIHGAGRVGAMVELFCETDFVAKNEDFKKLAYEIAMHVAATNPQFLKMEDISAEAREKAASAFTHELKDKPEAQRAKIMEGKLKAYFSEQVLLDQPFIKNQDITVAALIEGAIQKFGERTEIGRFTRFSIGS